MSMQKCYYDLLGVPRSASPDEMKKAYRKKALELHPDRNFGDEDTVKALFQEVQKAYEILSDPQERAWYDAHREQILHGYDDFTSYAGSGTTEDEIMRYFSASAYGNMDDSPKGFYTTYRTLFDTLLQEESTAYYEFNPKAENVDFPTVSFGYSHSPWEDVVKPFYDFWGNFATEKGFGWVEKYRLSEAPDRRIRRLMEKENKKLREAAKKAYTDAVRSLVQFIRKRDPRVKAATERLRLSNLNNRENAKKQAQLDREKFLETVGGYQEQDWAKVDYSVLDEHYGVGESDYDTEENENSEEQISDDEVFGQTEDTTFEVSDHIDVDVDDQDGPELHGASDTEDEEEEEEEELEPEDPLYCVPCSKRFKTPQQKSNHEKSKKHLKCLKDLKREMWLEEKRNRKLQKENMAEMVDDMENLDIGDDQNESKNGDDDADVFLSANEDAESSNDDSEKNLESTSPEKVHLEHSSSTSPNSSIPTSTKQKVKSSKSKRKGRRRRKQSLGFDSSSDSDPETKSNTQNQKSPEPTDNSPSEPPKPSIPQSQNAQSEPTSSLPSSSTSKSKTQSPESQEYNCNVCHTHFSSRNKLFNHIKVTGHAVNVKLKAGMETEFEKTKKKGKKKGKR